MSDPLNCEAKSSPDLTPAQLMASAMWGGIGSIVFSPVMGVFTVAWTRIITDTTARFALVLMVLSAIILACGKSAHLIVLILDHRYPNLPLPFSALPYLGAVFLGLGLVLVCSAVFYTTAVVLNS